MSQSSKRKKKISKAKYEETRLRPNGKREFKEFAENMIHIGYQGEDPLIYYLKSKPENLWNYYRVSDQEDDDRYCWDARRHCPDHAFDQGVNPVTMIKDILFSIEHRMLTAKEFYGPVSELVKAQDDKFGVEELKVPEDIPKEEE